MTRRAAVIALCLVAAACASGWTRAELLSNQVVAAVARIENDCLRIGWRPDQASKASQSARAIAELLAHSFPDREKLKSEILALDTALVGLVNGPDAIREQVQSAQLQLMQFQIELARRKRLINLMPVR